MANYRSCALGPILLLSWSLTAVSQPAAQQQQKMASTSYSIPSAPLPVDEIVKRLQERNAERSAALDEFEGTRVYRMQYRGFPSDRDAEMVITMMYHAPNSKEFKVVSQSGSKFIIEHVFKKLLEGEQEASNEENRRHTALTAENYDFTLAGYEVAPGGGRYILNLEPRSKNKFLYRGKIWVDAKDFAVGKIQGEPGKNPSIWIKKTNVEHTYMKLGDFWLPAENRTESVMRIGGIANLSIEYKSYRIIKAEPLPDSTAQKNP